MRVGSCAPGTYTHVVVSVQLRNLTRRQYTWDTPMALSSAYHKAPRWAAEELKKEKVKGRATIRAIGVDVTTRQGSWKD